MLRWTHATRLPVLMFGLALYGVADGMIVQAAIGIGPWDVLAQGISRSTGLLYGVVTILVGAVVLLFWIPLRQRPGIGTALNVLLVGTFAQFVLWLVPTPTLLIGQIALFAGGTVLLAAATGIYVGASYGAGPRDGLMTGLTARLGWPIWLSRGLVEVTVLLAGWALGGDVGVGTVAFALLIGPLCHVTIPLFSLRRIARVEPETAEVVR
ncbi:YitT family protein [Herbiconiux sp. L3-i23]|uniref:membrane protein YczE n=1 Tax=Herbiconiux sp. L3-i23 TaxID=2905871 RepID=UPI00204F1A22|nr:hypothetical protein [Herbiconiux sp. L3-i23]BDI24016.1 membrane protein [Herbiconiux sp. L3-i23]